MADPEMLATFILAGTLGLGIASAAALKGWQGWLDLKKLELQRGTAARPLSANRIDVADLKERVRKLEAIANGAD